MLKQAEKWFPDLGTMVSGHLLILFQLKGTMSGLFPESFCFQPDSALNGC
ncbi:hypothetical protein AAH079_02490 [Bacteroides thetaiotaomicron]